MILHIRSLMDINENINMEKNIQNEELLSRRRFFKNLSKGILPILGAVVLISIPVVTRAMEKQPMGCNYSCAGTCMNTCSGSCRGGCDTSCYNQCYSTCKTTCQGSCRRVTKY